MPGKLDAQINEGGKASFAVLLSLLLLSKVQGRI